MTTLLEFMLAMMVPTWSKPEGEGGGEEKETTKVLCSQKVYQSNLEELIFRA